MKKTREETDHTIDTLIEISAELFSIKGYASVSLDEIVDKAGLTRGAVYHHFKNKKGLFSAVFRYAQESISEQINRVDDQTDDLWEQLIKGCKLFVKATSQSSVCRIILIDGPAVLGWQTFRKVDQDNAMRLLQNQIVLMQKQGIFRIMPTEVVTHVLSGAMNEAAIWVAEQDNREKALDEAMIAIERMVEGFKVN